ncbi:MAG: hypothetical protein LAT81_08990, partial [Oceanicaulis sp.]|nr:hypothetical protein [Oceanicaulis sp.]
MAVSDAKTESSTANATEAASLPGGGVLDTVRTRRDVAAPPAAPEPAPPARGGGWIAFLGLAFGLLWAGGASAYLAGYTDLASLTAAQLAGLSVFAVAPALLFILAGLLGREVARAGSRARRLDLAVARLAAPLTHAETDTARLADAIAVQIARVNATMESALARLAAMEEVITHHADSLEDSSGKARERAEALVRSLRAEREKLSDVSESLDDKAALIAAAIQDQSKMVAAAAELADSRAAESEKRIRSGADRLK